MTGKSSTVVTIDGKDYNLRGFESEDYLRKVADFINKTITDIKSSESYGRITPDMRSIMLALNLADEYFKKKEQADEALDQLASMEKELYNLKTVLAERQSNDGTSSAKMALLLQQNQEFEEQLLELKKQNHELQLKNERLTKDLEDCLLK
ncbi:MAG: cell division protein ZapA [Lachnospiraceae bacterium]|nr:cell division protein ZapA [Lachnospiraceae bacterium]